MIAQILIAEDNPQVAALLAQYLADREHRVLIAKDGVELSRLAGEHLPHLIITDVQMPGAYGSTVYRMLEADRKTARIPVIFISGHPYEKLQGLLPDSAATRFVPKPIDFPALERCIRELLPKGGYLP